MPEQYCCTCNITITYATYENPGHYYKAGIFLKDGHSKRKQWLNSATKLKRNSPLSNKKDFHNEKLVLFSLDTQMFIRLPLTALVIGQNYLSYQRREKELSSYSPTPTLPRHGFVFSTTNNIKIMRHFEKTHKISCAGLIYVCLFQK